MMMMMMMMMMMYIFEVSNVLFKFIGVMSLIHKKDKVKKSIVLLHFHISPFQTLPCDEVILCETFHLLSVY